MVGAVLVGSVVVAAACAANNASEPSRAAGSDAGSVLDAVADALGIDHVVADAKASEKPTIDTLKCDKVADGRSYAERSYPSRPKEDLLRGSAMICDAATGVCQQTLMGLQDGRITVLCGKADSTVTVAMPPPL